MIVCFETATVFLKSETVVKDIRNEIDTKNNRFWYPLNDNKNLVYIVRYCTMDRKWRYYSHPQRSPRTSVP